MKSSSLSEITVLYLLQVVDGADVVIPLEAVKTVKDRFAYTLYGYFLGNRIAYPIVENYVKNAWAKFGLKKVMMNSLGFFFFKFDTLKGMEMVLEQGPWLIRSSPIILSVWTPNVSLTKQDITKQNQMCSIKFASFIVKTMYNVGRNTRNVSTAKWEYAWTFTLCYLVLGFVCTLAHREYLFHTIQICFCQLFCGLFVFGQAKHK